MPARRHTIAAAALLLATRLTAQQPVPRELRPDSSPPKRVSLRGAVEVPMLADTATRAQLPVVAVRIDGRGPFRFGVETGARFVTIRPALADSLGLRRTGGRDEAPEYHVDSMSVGAATFGDLHVTAVRTAAGDIDGVLGLPFYADLLLTLDYPRGVVRLERGALPAPDGREVLALSRVADFWGVPLRVGDATLTAVLDTRSTGSLGFTPTSAERVRFDGPLAVIGRARGASIPETEVRGGALADDVALGAYTLRRPFVSVRPLPPGFPTEPILGSGVLRQFVVTLDQRNARVRFRREGGTVVELPRPAARGAAVTAPAGGESGAALADYVGTYGDREITLDAGVLRLQRPGGQRLELVRTAGDAFTLREVPQARIEFVRDAAGVVREVRVLTREGRWETARRGG